MKIIRVRRCGGCPWCTSNFDCICPKNRGALLKITDLFIIHPDCPLEEAEEKHG